MTKRLTAQNWVDFALTTLAHEGFDALKADVLARKLGVSRGSFYWHFSDLDAFHVRVIEHWKRIATEAIIADIETYPPGKDRLNALLRNAFGHSAVLEVRIRNWADGYDAAARALSDIDRRRLEYLEELLVGVGIAPTLAATRAQFLYWAYLGAAWSRGALSGERLDRMVAELESIALGMRQDSQPPSRAAIGAGHPRRQRASATRQRPR